MAEPIAMQNLSDLTMATKFTQAPNLSIDRICFGHSKSTIEILKKRAVHLNPNIVYKPSRRILGEAVHVIASTLGW